VAVGKQTPLCYLGVPFRLVTARGRAQTQISSAYADKSSARDSISHQTNTRGAALKTWLK
jgi:hypothetical protein